MWFSIKCVWGVVVCMSENESGDVSAESGGSGGFEVDPLSDFDDLVNEIEESGDDSDDDGASGGESGSDSDPYQTTL